MTKRLPPPPFVAALPLPVTPFAAGGVLAATHSPSSPEPEPGPCHVAQLCWWDLCRSKRDFAHTDARPYGLCPSGPRSLIQAPLLYSTAGPGAGVPSPGSTPC